MSQHKIVFMASRVPARLPALPRSREFYQALGRAIKASRSEQGLERKELARRSGISYPYLSEIEKGTKRPSTEALLPIAQVLGLKQSELLLRAERLIDRGSMSGELSLLGARRRTRRVESPSQATMQEVVSRIQRLGADDLHLVLDVVRRLAS